MDAPRPHLVEEVARGERRQMRARTEGRIEETSSDRHSIRSRVKHHDNRFCRELRDTAIVLYRTCDRSVLSAISNVLSPPPRRSPALHTENMGIWQLQLAPTELRLSSEC